MINQKQRYQTPRHVAAACALVSNDAGDILLVKTIKRGWDIPGGQVELGEALTEAAIRETREEAGVQIELGALRVINSNLARSILIFGYHAQYVSGEPTPQPGEIEAVQWVKRDDVLDMITHPVCKQRIKDLLETDRGVLYRAYTPRPFEIVETQHGI